MDKKQIGTDRIYLGDGIYTYFDGYTIWLRVTRTTGVDEIALEPAVLESLDIYRNNLDAKYGCKIYGPKDYGPRVTPI
jgi:hypothetical protein